MLENIRRILAYCKGTPETNRKNETRLQGMGKGQKADFASELARNGFVLPLASGRFCRFVGDTLLRRAPARRSYIARCRLMLSLIEFGETLYKTIRFLV